MSSLLFLLLHAAKDLAGPHDTAIFVLCVGLDQIVWVSLWRLRLYLRGR